MKILFAVRCSLFAVRCSACRRRCRRIAAIVATTAETLSRTSINRFNFYGYFTIQSNILYLIACLVAATATFRGKQQSSGVMLFRASATTYVVIVGIV